MRKPTARPTKFLGLLDGQPVVLLATPPDESLPGSDFRWQIVVLEEEDGVTGNGFTSHQAVHDIIERYETAGHALTNVVQVHEER